jgi:hypothetical protein
MHLRATLGHLRALVLASGLALGAFEVPPALAQMRPTPAPLMVSTPKETGPGKQDRNVRSRLTRPHVSGSRAVEHESTEVPREQRREQGGDSKEEPPRPALEHVMIIERALSHPSNAEVRAEVRAEVERLLRPAEGRGVGGHLADDYYKIAALVASLLGLTALAQLLLAKRANAT